MNIITTAIVIMIMIIHYGNRIFVRRLRVGIRRTDIVVVVGSSITNTNTRARTSASPSASSGTNAGW